MNLLDAVVTKIMGPPYFKHGFWWVQVEANCWGRPTTNSLFFDSKEEAEKIKVGYEYIT